MTSLIGQNGPSHPVFPQVVAADGVSVYPSGALQATDVQQALERLANVHNVKSYGAFGDGSHDDTTAIQRVIDLANAAGGGTVYLPAGTFRVSGLQLISNIRFVGAGIGVTFLKLTDNAVNFQEVIRVAGTDPTDRAAVDVEIAHLTIDGNRDDHGLSGNQMHAIDVRENTQRLLIHDVGLTKTGGDGIRVTRGSSITDSEMPRDITIRSCFVYDVGRNGIAVIQGYRIAIIGNITDNIIDAENDNATVGLRHITIQGNVCQRIGISSQFDDRMECVASGNIVTGVDIDNVSVSINITGHVAFTGNSVFGAIRCHNQKDTAIVGNRCKVIAITGTNSATPSERIIVADNIITNRDDTDDDQITTWLAAIRVREATDTQIHGNIIQAPAHVGIRVDANNIDVYLRDNYIVDSGTALFISGTGATGYARDNHIVAGAISNSSPTTFAISEPEVLREDTVATTNATQTTLATIPVPASTTVHVEAHVYARRTGGTGGTAEDAAGYVIHATFKNVAGTATLVGAVSATYTAEDQAGWDATFTVSGADALLRVTGAANNNVRWRSTTQVYQVST